MQIPLLVGKTLLLVDDRPENLLSLEALLEGSGAIIQKAFSGNEALKFLYRNAAATACVLLDVQMPEMSGYETAALLRQLPATAAIPVLFVTAKEEGAARVDAPYDALLTEPVFLHKPLSAPRLFAALERVLQQKA